MALKKYAKIILRFTAFIIPLFFIISSSSAAEQFEFNVSPAVINVPAIKPGMYCDTSFSISRQQTDNESNSSIILDRGTLPSGIRIQIPSSAQLILGNVSVVVPVSLAIDANVPPGSYRGAIDVVESGNINNSASGVAIGANLGHRITLAITITNADILHVVVNNIAVRNSVSAHSGGGVVSEIIVEGTVLNDGTLPVSVHSAVLSLTDTRQKAVEEDIDKISFVVPPLSTKYVRWLFSGSLPVGQYLGNIKIFSDTQNKPIWNDLLLLRVSPGEVATEKTVPTSGGVYGWILVVSGIVVFIFISLVLFILLGHRRPRPQPRPHGHSHTAIDKN